MNGNPFASPMSSLERQLHVDDPTLDVTRERGRDLIEEAKQQKRLETMMMPTTGPSRGLPELEHEPDNMFDGPVLDLQAQSSSLGDIATAGPGGLAGPADPARTATPIGGNSPVSDDLELAFGRDLGGGMDSLGTTDAQANPFSDLPPQQLPSLADSAAPLQQALSPSASQMELGGYHAGVQDFAAGGMPSREALRRILRSV